VQAGRISVGWFAAECDECLIVGAGIPLGAERGACQEGTAGCLRRFDDLLPDTAL
jgi:hypothetical protein